MTRLEEIKARADAVKDARPDVTVTWHDDFSGMSDFIANCHADVPWLVERVKRLERADKLLVDVHKMFERIHSYEPPHPDDVWDFAVVIKQYVESLTPKPKDE